MKTIVLSGINLFEGGPISIYYDCLDAVREMKLHERYHITAFVHKRELFEDYSDIVNLIELPKSRKSYLNRLYYEYGYFHSYSRKRDIDIWVSLHDITPRVRAKKLYTYCHNPSPFMKKDITKIRYSFRVVAFSFFYKYLYRIHIQNATAVIVQQDWMRKEFEKMYPVKEVIVARPAGKSAFCPERGWVGERESAGRTDLVEEKSNQEKSNQEISNQETSNQAQPKVFFFPALPRYFKNYEQICEAVKLLKSKEFRVIFTVDGSENPYAADLRRKYGDLQQIEWIGIQERSRVFEIYNSCDCLIFPSKLETWGLPVSEFKETGKDILLIDLPYAHETVGTYEKVMFFQEDDAKGLSELMDSVLEGRQKYTPAVQGQMEEPYAQNWQELLQMLIAE